MTEKTIKLGTGLVIQQNTNSLGVVVITLKK